MVEIFVDIESELSESINFAIEVFLNLKIFFNPCKNHKPKQKWYSSLTSFELQYIHFLSSIGHFIKDILIYMINIYAKTKYFYY